MAQINLTPAKTELRWLDSGTIQIMVQLTGSMSTTTSLSIDTLGNVTNSQGVVIGTLTATQLTALQNLGAKIDNLISTADAAGKITF